MSNSNQPTIAGDIRRIHLAITRALDVAIEHTSMFAETKSQDIFSLGFINYVQSLLSLLHSHHLVEDEQIFPYLKTKLVNAPFELMEAQHQEMLPVLDEVEKQLASIEKNKLCSPKALIEFNQQLVLLREIWHPHIQTEEEYINDTQLDTIVDPQEQSKQSEAFAHYAGSHIVADYLVMPFILYNLEPEDRAAISQIFPPVVIQQLIPIDWRSQWESMSPFFVEEIESPRVTSSEKR